MIKKKFKIPLFRGTLVLIKDKDFKKTGKKYGFKIPEKYGAVTLRNNNCAGFEYVVCFIDGSTSIMAHEAVHVCNYVFKDVHLNADLDNDETQAYLVGWIVGKMDKFLNKNK